MSGRIVFGNERVLELLRHSDFTSRNLDKMKILQRVTCSTRLRNELSPEGLRHRLAMRHVMSPDTRRRYHLDAHPVDLRDLIEAMDESPGEVTELDLIRVYGLTERVARKICKLNFFIILNAM